MAAADAQELTGGADRLAGAQLRPWLRAPDEKGLLDDRRPGLRAGCARQPREQLDVECPTLVEGFREGLFKPRSRAKCLRPALGVVYADAEGQRGKGRVDPAQVVPEFAALDIGPEAAPPGAENHRQTVIRGESIEEPSELLDRGREIRIRVGDQLCTVVQGLAHSMPDSLTLAAVALQADHRHAVRMRLSKALEKLTGRIGRAIVDEDEGPLGSLADRARKRRQIQPLRLVEARNDNGSRADSAAVSQAAVDANG